MSDSFVPTSTQVVIICPRCAQAVILPFVKVEVEIGDSIVLGHHGEFPTSLNAEIQASGPHSCPRPDTEYKIDLPHGTAGM